MYSSRRVYRLISSIVESMLTILIMLGSLKIVIDSVYKVYEKFRKASSK